ncbi:hypothetical protein BDV18DRAFT_105982 [Aspergillus unguis]
MRQLVYKISKWLGGKKQQHAARQFAALSLRWQSWLGAVHTTHHSLAPVPAANAGLLLISSYSALLGLDSNEYDSLCTLESSLDFEKESTIKRLMYRLNFRFPANDDCLYVKRALERL